MMRTLWIALSLFYAVPTQADPYRLTIGDTLTVSLAGTPQVTQTTVDLDGWLRVPGLAQVQVQGLTLDESQDAMEAALIEMAHMVDPQVMVAIDSYASIVVSGDVMSPGPIAFQPNMSVEVAIGLAGAVRQGDIPYRLQALQADMALREAIGLHEVAQNRVAIFSYLLSDQDIPFVHDDQTLVSFVAAHRDRLSGMMDEWGYQVAETSTLITGLEARLSVQDQIIASRDLDALSAQSLAERQLGTNDAAETAARNAIEAQARKLELETAVSEARIHRAALRRDMATTRDGIVLEWTERLMVAEREMQEAVVRIATAETRLQLFGGVDHATGPSMSYQIIRHTRTGSTRLSAQPSTLLQPGDTVLVAQGAPDGNHLVTSYLD